MSTSPSEPLGQPLAALRGKPDKEKILSLCRNWLDGERQAIKDRFLASNDAASMLAAHSHAMDELLQSLFSFFSPHGGVGISLIAVGGYGRRELFPYSDIDLLFLYEGDSAHAAAIAESMLYVLWDLGLAVGHAHRSLDEAMTLAKEDMTIRTTLLDARLLAGNAALYERFHRHFRQEIVVGAALEFVEAKLAERDARHLRFGDSRYMLEPNVKEGKGGLRDLHTLWWLAQYIYSIGTIKDLVKMKLLTPEEYRAFDRARTFLWRTRIHLHYLAGRPEERLTFDRQQALAPLMGYPHPSINRSIERFMRHYFAAVRTVGSLTRIFCALLEEEHQRRPRRSLAWLTTAPWKLGAFRIDGERLNVRHEDSFEKDPVLMIELFRMAQLHDLDIHPKALRLIGRNLRRINDNLRQDPRANALFLDILLAYQGPEATLRRMSEAGVLGRFIPEFGRVIGQTQFNMYHVYTVDEHTLVALGILHNVEQGKLAAELPLASEIIRRLQMKRVLYLALFCHDIAKGRGGDHSTLGERIVTRLARRFGFSIDEAETAAWLVRQHLLFSNTVFKRDIEDPRTVQDFVATVKSPERLKLLLVLTVADIRAVGPAVWNAWKAALMRELFRRAEQAMGTAAVELRPQEADSLRQKLLMALPGWKESEVDAYLEQGSPAFRASFDAPRHAVIARMIREARGSQLPLLMDTQHDYERSMTEITLVTYDQHALFSKLAGAMALAGAGIISAKIFTLKDGLAVDVFQVQDAAGQVFDRPDRLARMSVYIEQALCGELDLAEALLKRTRSAHPSRDAVRAPAQVFIENNASHICSVVELTGHDRPGFLYDVTQTMAALGLQIATAHISTYGTQAADVFYVKDIFGMKITHDAKLQQVREALLKAIEPL
ncbi:MAG: [protein-PII] uridylyltransferase [Pseudomonadota bacterium]|nr:[protein-PII] uridylyltransferase [Pseudomonadota bacterium]